MRKLTAVTVAAVAMLTLAGCGGEDVDGYTEATTYLETDNPHVSAVFDDSEQALAWGRGACKTLGDKDAEHAFAVNEALHGMGRCQAGVVALGAGSRRSCSDHHGETIDWYRGKYVDAAGRWKGNLNELDDWQQYLSDDWEWWGPKDVDDNTRTITRPMLIDDEKQWLRQHRTMPRIRPGKDMHDAPERLEDIPRLTDVRVLNGRKGVRTYRTRGLDPYTDDDAFSRANDSEPKHNWMDGSYDLRLVRTIPAAGKPTGPEGVMLVARWVWTPNDEDGDGIPDAQDDVDNNSYSYSSGGDDDYNVPGWLCPTRFC